MKKILVIFSIIFIFSFLGCGSEKIKSGEYNNSVEQGLGVLKMGTMVPFEKSTEVAHLIFDTITGLGFGFKPEPNIISSWNIGEGYLNYDLHISPNITFHDGTKVSAEIVKWNIENGGKYSYATFIKVLDKIEIVSESHLRVSFKSASMYFLQELSKILLVPINSYTEQGKRNTKIGTGPYMYDSITDGGVVILKKNLNYWNKNYKNDIDEVQWHYIADDQTRKMALTNGQIDVLGLSEHFPSLSCAVMNELKNLSEFEEVRLGKNNYGAVLCINFNWKEGATTNVDLRRGLEYIIDRQDLINQMFFGIGEPSGHMYNSTVFDGPRNEKPFTYDLEKAKKYIEKAGYVLGNENKPTVDKSGKPLKLKLAVSNREADVDTAMYIQNAFKKHGIEVEINSLGGPMLGEILKVGDFNMALFTHLFTPITRSFMLTGLTDDYSTLGLGFCINQEMRDIVKEYLNCIDEKEMRKIADRIWEIQYDQAVSVPLTAKIRYIFHNKKFTGFHFVGNVMQIDLNGVKRVK